MILLMAGIPRKKQGSAVHLSVDTTIAYQVIEGFGAFNTLSFWKEDYGRKIDFLANDMGLSIFRFELPPTFQPVKGGPAGYAE